MPRHGDRNCRSTTSPCSLAPMRCTLHIGYCRYPGMASMSTPLVLRPLESCMATGSVSPYNRLSLLTVKPISHRSGICHLSICFWSRASVAGALFPAVCRHWDGRCNRWMSTNGFCPAIQRSKSMKSSPVGYRISCRLPAMKRWKTYGLFARNTVIYWSIVHCCAIAIAALHTLAHLALSNRPWWQCRRVILGNWLVSIDG